MHSPTSNERLAELAGRWGVPVEQVADWLDDGYTIPEIERACRIGQEKQAAPSDVLAMLDAGLDWRTIEKSLRAVPDVDDLDDDEAY